MPFGDGTGPLGKGPFTGRKGGGTGRGRGLGRGVGRTGGVGGVSPIRGRATNSNPTILTKEQEELAQKIYQYLPKINCGACGYPTCTECARAIAKGEAPYNACRVLKPEQHEKIKEILERR